MSGLRAMAVVGAMAFSAIACDDNDDIFTPPGGPGPGSGSNLTVVNSTPADGNATLTVTGTFTPNFGGSGRDELNLSQTTGAVGHDVTILWDTNTHALHSVEHGWGAAVVSITHCVVGTADACDTARVTIDFAGQTVTFNNLALVDTSGGTAVSTLNGTARW
jgi:hypothetical protein